MTKACLDESSIVNFAHGALSPERMQPVEAHLARCAECRRLASQMARQTAPPRPDDSRARDTIALADPAPKLPPREAADPPSKSNNGPARTFARGDLVAERYRIERFIAKGGMAEVYAADDVKLNDRLALKALRPVNGATARLQGRLKREMRLARRITHPNVCRLFELGFHRSSTESAGVTFLTMELLEGETLAARLRREGRIGPAEALPIVAQLAAGLGAAHAAGVVHRDFKTGNVFLVPNAQYPGGTRVVIIDFGLASGHIIDTRMTPLGTVVGTPRYMAPEQLVGQRAGVAADIYALGVVMFEMITGQLPFAGDTMPEVGRRLREAPPRPSTLVSGLSPRWEAAILRCLEIDPAARFQAAWQVALALHEVPQPAPPPVAVNDATPAQANAATPPAETKQQRSRDGAPSPAPSSQRRAAHAPAAEPAPPEAGESPPKERPASSPRAHHESSRSRHSKSRRRSQDHRARARHAESRQERRGESPARSRVRSFSRALLRARFWPALLLPVVLALVTLLILHRAHAPRRHLLVPSETGVRRTLAVLDLSGATNGAEGAAIAEVLRDALSADHQLRVLDGDAVTRAAIELALDGAEPLTPQQVLRLQQRLGVDYLVRGVSSIAAENEGNVLRAEVQLHQQRVDDTATRIAAEGAANDLASVAAQLGTRLRQELGLGELPAAEPTRARALLPEPAAALQLYGEGLVHHRRFDEAGARDRWQRAVALAPAHPWLHAALAMAADALGYRTQAAAEAERTLQLSAPLPARDKSLLEARAQAAVHRWDQAIPPLQALLRSAPDDVAIAVSLANAECAQGDLNGALAVIARLRHLPPPVGDDPALDLAEAQCQLAASDWEGARVAASAAAGRANARGAVALAAAARRCESTALLRSGKGKPALAAADEALQLATRAHDPEGQVDAWLAVGAAHAQASGLAPAQQHFARALAEARQRGDLTRTFRASNDLAVIAQRQGHLEEAARAQLESAEVMMRAGAPALQLTALHHAAALFAQTGKLSESERVWERAVELARRVRDQPAELDALLARASLDLAQARLDEALALAKQALALARARGATGAQLSLLGLIGAARLHQGDLAGARHALEDCLATPPAGAAAAGAVCLGLMTEVLLCGDDIVAARRRADEAMALQEADRSTVGPLALARVLVESGDFKGALTAATATFLLPDEDAEAQLVVARAHLAERRLAEARTAAARAHADAGNERVILRLRAGIVAAEISAAGGELAPARTELSAIIDEANRHKLAYVAMQAELARAGLDADPDHRAAIIDLQRRAASGGFQRIAREAAAVAPPLSPRKRDFTSLRRFLQ
jgi:serine/threonine protein kinase/tetratricopeptide (TPR) repeat protein